MVERLKRGERAILVQFAEYHNAESMAELHELAISAGANPVARLSGKKRPPDPRWYIGRGKLDELSQLVKEYHAELVLFDNALSPNQ